MSDVLIIGGGIVGLACAYELASAGASVTVLEYGKTGMQATNAAAGMLAPLSESNDPGPLLPFAMRAHGEYPALAQQLEDQCGFDLELRLDGILKVAFDDAEAAALQRRLAWQRELGLPVEWLDGAMCRELEPKLSPGVIGGLFSSSEGSVSNQLVALALERARAGSTAQSSVTAPPSPASPCAPGASPPCAAARPPTQPIPSSSPPARARARSRRSCTYPCPCGPSAAR